MLLLALAVPQASGKNELSLARETIDSLTRASEELERGNAAAAEALLAGMAESVARLRGTANRFRDQATSVGSACRARSLAVITEINATYQKQQEAEQSIKQLTAELENVQAQHNLAQQQLKPVEMVMAELRREAEVRQLCVRGAKEFFDNFGECMRLSFQDLFDRRWEKVNAAYSDLSRQRNQLFAAMNDLQSRRSARERELVLNRSRVAQFHEERKHLEQQDLALRMAVTALADISLFWDKTGALVTSRMANPIALLKDLMPTLDKTSTVPAFDKYDRQDIRSLRQTLLDFSRTLDDRTNFLLSPSICR